MKKYIYREIHPYTTKLLKTQNWKSYHTSKRPVRPKKKIKKKKVPEQSNMRQKISKNTIELYFILAINYWA